MRYENCDKRDDVVAAVLRRPGVRIPGIAFDVGCRGNNIASDRFDFRSNSGYTIELKPGRTLDWLPHMDICEVAWDALTLVLTAGEQVSYTALNIPEECPLFLEAETEEDTQIQVCQNGVPFSPLTFCNGDPLRREAGTLHTSPETQITLKVMKGRIKLHALSFGDVTESHYDSFLEIEIP